MEWSEWPELKRKQKLNGSKETVVNAEKIDIEEAESFEEQSDSEDIWTGWKDD